MSKRIACYEFRSCFWLFVTDLILILSASALGLWVVLRIGKT
jgi:hypothetical protein